MPAFSFNDAFLHFMRTEGPSGFFWKYFLSYIAVMGLIFGVTFFVYMSAFIPFFTAIESGAEPEPEQVLGFMLPMFGIILLFIPVYVVATSMFEAAALRRYIRKDGFSLGFGADELRVLGVMLIWFGAIVLAYIAFFLLFFLAAIPIALTGSDGAPPLGLFILIPVFMLVFGIAALFFGVRLSPASAITIRDRKVQFTSAWRVTRNRFWAMFGAFFLIYIISYVAQIVVQGVMLGGFGVAAASNPDIFESDDVSAVLGLLSDPTLLITSIIGGLLLVGIYGFMHFAYLGITSKAALTDPDWQGDLSTADVFE